MITILEQKLQIIINNYSDRWHRQKKKLKHIVTTAFK